MRADSVIPLVLAVAVAIGAFAVLGGGVTASGESTAFLGEDATVQGDGVAFQHGTSAFSGETKFADGEASTQANDSGHSTVEVTALQADTVVVEWGTSLSFSATVTNTGQEEVRQEIEFAVEGVGVLASESVTLDGGEQSVVEFAGIDTAELAEEGDYQFTVSSDDDSQSGTLVVDDPGPAVLFEVFDIHIETDPENVTLDEPEDVEVSATVRNTGTERGTQTVEFLADDVTVDEIQLTLDDGESERVTFTRTAVNHTLDREYRYSIASANDEVTGTLVVQEPEDTAEPTDNGDDATADDDGSGFGVAAALLGLLAGTLLVLMVPHRQHSTGPHGRQHGPR